MTKIVHILLNFLVFTLPLVCSNLPEFFWLSDIWRINGNYEFFKVLYFNIFSSVIIILYTLWVLFRKHTLKINKNTLILLWLFLIANMSSTLFSLFPTESLLGWTNKGHGMLFWNNVIGLSIIFLNLKKNQLHSLVSSFLYCLFIVVLFWIWQHYVPSFDYWDLSNRAVSTLGHPNYLAGLILISIPLLSTRKYISNSFIRYTIKYISIWCLFLTKSWLAIVLFLIYTILRKIKFKRYNYLYPSVILLAWAITAFIQFPEKLHSFISRFYIWETTLNIILSNIPKVLSWFWSETLTIYFDNFKSPELYIFENFWFTADRPHNVFLNFFYHFWIIWLTIIVSLYYFVSKKLKSTVGVSLWLIAIFLLFNYASVALYLIVLILLSSLAKASKKSYSIHTVMLFIIACLAIWNIYYSSKLYLAERSIYLSGNYRQALNILLSYELYQYENKIFTHPIHTEQYYLQKLYASPDYINNCDELTSNFSSIENYIYCWDILEQAWKQQLAQDYYQSGIDLLPDIWEKDSKYWNNPIIKKSISWNRFYSEKYWNIWEILEKLNIKKTNK